MPIFKNDIKSLTEHAREMKAACPQVFTRRVKGRGFMLVLDPDGTKAKGEPKRDSNGKRILEPGQRQIFCAPKEEECHRCGYEYPEVGKGERKPKQCPKCVERQAGAVGRLPGIVASRDMAMTEVAKDYLTQARTLVGMHPMKLGPWAGLEGIRQIAKILEMLDGNPVSPAVLDKPKMPRKNMGPRMSDVNIGLRDIYSMMSMNVASLRRLVGVLRELRYS